MLVMFSKHATNDQHSIGSGQPLEFTTQLNKCRRQNIGDHNVGWKANNYNGFSRNRPSITHLIQSSILLRNRNTGRIDIHSNRSRCSHSQCTNTEYATSAANVNQHIIRLQVFFNHQQTAHCRWMITHAKCAGGFNRNHHGLIGVGQRCDRFGNFLFSAPYGGNDDSLTDNCWLREFTPSIRDCFIDSCR